MVGFGLIAALDVASSADQENVAMSNWKRWVLRLLARLRLAVGFGRTEMITLRLPDGSIKQVPEGTRPREVAESIGKRLAQAAIAAKVNGAVIDLERELPSGNGELSFQILTDKDPEALEVLRHSSAHVLARAVMRLFPGVQLAFHGVDSTLCAPSDYN